jgi:dolichol kinase
MALFGTAIPYYQPIPFYLAALTALFCLGLGLFVLNRQQSIRRPGEQSCIAAIGGYGIAVIPLFLLFPAHPELALSVAAIIAFGDGSATLVGLLAGAAKLPWNRNKSWAGTSAFIFVGLPMAALIWWSASIPHVPPAIAVICAAPAVLASAFVESLPIRLNDNIFVGACAAVGVVFMHGAVMGWS